MSAVVEIRNLFKHFERSSVLSGIDLKLEQGSVLGLLGVNAAGKTTLIRCMLGLLKPSSGEALVYGHEAWNLPPHIKQKIGFVAQVPDLFAWMKVEQMLKYNAMFYENWNQAKAEDLLRNWDLLGSMRVAKMSEGQRQRLAIVLAMSHEPDLLILDEPVSALDPVGRREFIRQLIELNADEGKSILFSTHIVSDLERIAAEVAIVRDGRVYYQGEIDTLKENVVRLKIRSQNTLPANLEIPKLLSARISGNLATACVREFDPPKLEVLKNNLQAEIAVEQLCLEDIFLEINHK